MGLITGLIGMASAVVGTLSKVGIAIEAFKVIGGLLTALGKALGLIKAETKVEELGDKAIQSELNPNDFDTYAEYVKEVEAFDKLDPEKSKEISEKDKIEKGMELAAGATLEKFDFSKYPIAGLCTVLCERPGVMTEEKMQEIGKIISRSPETITDIYNCIKDIEKDEGKQSDTIELLKSVEKIVNPNISDDDALFNVLDLINWGK